MKTLLVLPTYNEKENIEKILNNLLQQTSLDILVVDDNSPDNTAQIVKKIQAQESRVFLIERPAKLGLGTAYITGFQWGLKKDMIVLWKWMQIFPTILKTSPGLWKR